MATQVQFRRGTAAQNDSFTGGAGELSINLTTKAVRVHDGSTQGGFELARADLTNVTGNIPAQPGGINASVQFNNLGTMTGSSEYTYDSINQVVTMPNVAVVGTVSTHIIPAADITYDLGNTTNKWRDLYLSGNTIYIGDANIKSYQQIVLIQGLSITANGAVDVANAPPSGGLFVAGAGNFAANVNIGNVMTSNRVESNIANVGLANISGNLNVGGNANIASNLLVANITSNGTITANVVDIETLVVSNITVTGNLAPNKINFTDTIVNIGAANAEVTVSVAGTTNVAVFSTTGTTTTGLTVTGNTDLGDVGNVQITGGNANAFLQTDGNGNLVWTTVDASSVSNGTSNLTIPVQDGPVRIAASGTANVLVVTSSGTTVTGNLDSIGNLNVTGDETISGNLTIAGVTNMGAVANIRIANGTNGQYLQTDGNGNVLWASISGSGISNGASDVSIPVANGNVTSTVNGNAILTVASAGANVFGTLDVTNAVTLGSTLTVSGNVTASANLSVTVNTSVSNLTATGNVNLGDISNVHISNGVAGQYMTTDGAGNLNWSTIEIPTYIANGTSSVAIPVEDSNVVVTVGSNNVVNITGTGANVIGTLDVTGNVTVSNLTANGNVNVSNLTANGNVQLGAIGDVNITGGNVGQVIKTDGAGNLSFANVPGGTNTQVQFNDNGNLSGSQLHYYANGANTFLQYGSVNETFTTGQGISFVYNTTSNTQTIRLDDTANTATTSISTRDITTGGTLNVGNTATFTGNAAFTGANVSLGAVANLKIANGNSGQFLQTDGAGNLSWQTISADRISNVNSNVVIDGANGNILFAANNQSNVIIISSNGTHSHTTVQNDVTVTGNLTVTGNSTYINSTSQYIVDPIIDMGTGANNSPLTTNDGLDRGITLHTYGIGDLFTTNSITPAGNTVIELTSTTGITVGQEVAFNNAIPHGTKVTIVNSNNIVIDTATTSPIPLSSAVSVGMDALHFIGWDSSASEFLVAANATIANGLVTTTGSLGNIRIGKAATESITVSGNLTANGNSIFNTGNVEFNGPNVTFTGARVDLGAVANIKIANGSNGQLLQTDGNGNISWITVSTDRISNGNSNSFVVGVDGNVTTTINSNLITTTSAGGLEVVGNISATSNVTTVNFTANGIVDLGAVANIKIANGSNGQLLRTDGNGNISWATFVEAAPHKYSLEWNVDALNGDDMDGTGGVEKPFLTISKAITQASAGDVIYLHAGTFTENVTVPAITIKGTGNGVVLSGNWTYSSTANTYVSGVVHTGTVTVNNTGTTMFGDVRFAGALTTTNGSKTTFVNSYIEAGLSVTGTSTNATLVSGKIKDLTVNGPSSVVRVNNSLRLENTLLTTGTLYISDSDVFSTTAGNPSIQGSGGVIYVQNSTIYGQTEASLGFIQGSFDYSLINVTYDLLGSTLTGSEEPTNISYTGISQVANLTVTTIAELGLVSAVKIGGGSNLQFLQTDGTGNLAWSNPVASALVNGNSNVIVDNNSSIRLSAIGVANIITIDDINSNVNSNLNVSGALVVAGNTRVSNVTANGIVTLGNVADIRISGGSNTQFLQTDGNGNLVFATPSLSSLVNGNSNVIVAANSDISLSSGGSANVLLVTKTGANIAGTGNITGELSVGANITAISNVNVGGNIVVTGTTALTGNLTANNVAFTGNVQLGNVDNVHINGGSTGQFLSTDGNGDLSWANAGAGGSNTQVQFNDGGSDLGGNSKFTFNKTTSNLTVDKISILGSGTIYSNAALTVATPAVSTLSIIGGNATSAGDTGGNILVRSGDSPDLSTAAGKITIQAGDALGGTNGGNAYVMSGNSVAGQAGNIYIAPGQGPNVAFDGQTVFSGKVNLGAIANVRISGGSNAQILSTDGQGNLSWSTGSNLIVSSISDGNSNVRIASTNGNVMMAVNGSNVFTLTSIGAYIGNGVPLTGLTNPIVGATSSANSYIQSYIYNQSNTVHASSDFVAYPNNGTDSSGWIDVGITSNSFVDANYAVTARNEGYVFMSAPAGSGSSGNLVIATDSTGSNNAIEFYTGGFTSVKGANRPMFIASNEVKISGNLSANGANVSLGTVANLRINGAADGALLMANGTGGNVVWGLVLDGGTA